jgi:hypothetical protein
MNLLKKKHALLTGAFFTILVLLFTQCHRAKPALQVEDKSPSAQQLARFDSLKSTIVKNRKLMELTLHAAKSITDLQRLGTRNIINQVATQDLDSIARTQFMHHDDIDRYLTQVSDIIEIIMAPYLIRGLDLNADGVTRERITNYLALKFECDSLLRIASSEPDVVKRLEQVTKALHRLNADTTMRELLY